MNDRSDNVYDSCNICNEFMDNDSDTIFCIPATGPSDAVNDSNDTVDDSTSQRRYRRQVTQDVYVDVVAMADFGVYAA